MEETINSSNMNDFEYDDELLRDEFDDDVDMEEIDDFIKQSADLCKYPTTDNLRLYLESIDKLVLPNVSIETLIERRDNAIENSPEYDESIKLIIEMNLKLVLFWAFKKAPSIQLILDLTQAGNEGLMKAAKMYNKDFGTQFSTYASIWIKQYMSRELTRYNSLHIPVHVTEKIGKIIKFISKYEQKYGEKPTYSQIAKEFKTDELTIGRLLNGGQALSLDSVNPDDDEHSDDPMIMRIVDDSQEDIDIVVIRKILFEQLMNLIETDDTLQPRECQVLKERFDLDGKGKGEGKTLVVLGNRYGLTRERIRQIEQNALKKLRETPCYKKLLLELRSCS